MQQGIRLFLFSTKTSPRTLTSYLCHDPKPNPHTRNPTSGLKHQRPSRATPSPPSRLPRALFPQSVPRHPPYHDQKRTQQPNQPTPLSFLPCLPVALPYAMPPLTSRPPLRRHAPPSTPQPPAPSHRSQYRLAPLPRPSRHPLRPPASRAQAAQADGARRRVRACARGHGRGRARGRGRGRGGGWSLLFCVGREGRGHGRSCWCCRCRARRRRVD